MYIKALALSDFRNIKQLNFMPCEGKNLVYGENAQGKTNLLEAIHLCAFGRSERTVHDDEMIMQGKRNAVVKVRVCSEQIGEHTVSVYLSDQKTIEVDGVRIKRLAELMGMLKVVMFSPESLLLVKGSPQERRRFMDMCISQLSKAYFFRLQQYSAALRQRNALLKTPDANKARDYIRMWDEQLCISGTYIMTARERFLQNLSPAVNKMHTALSAGRETIEIDYAPSLRESGAEDLQSVFMDRLDFTFDDDVKRGTTGTGPHKDDIRMLINGADARSYASQGQQRTAALSLRLSEIDFIKSVSGENPVVLLDDVFSELDDARCAALLECMGGCQCILTSAQKPAFDIGGAKLFECREGEFFESAE